MDTAQLEQIITSAMQIGVYNTLNELGLLSEIITEKQAEKKYTKRLIKDWRHKRWIVGYPTGNSDRSKVYFKRSELETASRMLDIQNLIPGNVIFSKIKHPE
jgi:hypothetical protein